MDERVKRQDLLTGQNIALPEGYVGHRIFPPLDRYTKTGSFYYIAKGAATNVVNGRTAGAVVTPTNNKGTPQAFVCVERSDRQLVDDSEVNMYGGWDKYQMHLAANAYVNVADITEAAIAAALFAVTAFAASGTTLYERIQQALIPLRGKRGKVALIASQTMLLAMRQDTSITAHLSATGMVPADVDPRFVSNKVLAACLNVSEVIEGLDAMADESTPIFPASKLAVMVLPDPAFEPHQQIQAGRTIRYLPDQAPGAILYQAWEGYDSSRKGKFVDVESFATPYVLNTDRIKILDEAGGPSSGSGSGSGA